MEKDDTELELDKRLLELTTLFEISKTLTSSLNLRSILENSLRIIMGHMLISRGVILLRTSEENEFSVEELKGFSRNLIGKLVHLEHPPDRPVFAKDLGSISNWNLIFKEFELELIIPLIASNGVLGIVALGEKIGGKAYEESELEFLKSISNIAATSVANGRMVEEIQNVNRRLDRRIQQLNTIFDISRELNTTLGPAKIGSLLSFAVMGELLVNKCLIFTYTNSTAEVLVSKGFSDHQSIKNRIINISHPICLEDSDNYEDFKASGFMVLVPMRLQDETRGLMAIGPKISNVAFTPGELEFLTILGNQAMTSIENARLFEEMVEKQRMEEELNLARSIQQGLLPKSLPVLRDYELCGLNIPSRRVGGDYYDIIKINETNYSIIIADVSGKGAGAALLMANLQAGLHALLYERLAMGQMVSRVNKLIFNNTALDKYITFFYGQLDTEKNIFTYCNAGHNPPYRTRMNGEYEELMNGGIVLGMLEHADYITGTVFMQPGDSIVMFTDGITESMNEKEEEFGEERVIQLIQENLNLNAEDLMGKIVDATQDFRGEAPQSDDITMVVLKRK